MADEPQTSRAPTEEPQESPSAADAMHDAARHADEFREYLSYYLSAQKDRLLASIRRHAATAVIVLALVLLGAVALVTAAVLLVIGAAQGIAELMGGRMWAGNLIVGGGLCLLTAIGLLVARQAMLKRSYRTTVKKYEQRKEKQRRHFGRDVTGQDTQQAP